MDAANDILRRSKRNKFHLDVAAIHGHPSKKSRLDQLSVVVEPSSSETSNGAEETRRSRRSLPYRNLFSVYADADDDDMDRAGLDGPYACTKCPARYETKPGLINHNKLHGGEKRENACELCDFSSLTQKALRRHQRIHDTYGVLSAQPSPVENSGAPNLLANNSEKEEDTWRSGSATPPRLSPELPKPAARRVARSLSPPPLLAHTITGKSKKTLVPKLEKKKYVPKFQTCSLCPFKAVNKQRMIRHIAGHQKDSGYKCPAKGCTFKSESAGFLKRHFDQSHKKQNIPWVTPIYVRSGEAQRQRLSERAKNHLTSARRTREGRYVCNVDNCYFTTLHKPILVTHKLRAHLNDKFQGEYPYKWCRECGVSFSSAVKLRVHKLRMHRKIRHPHSRCFFLAELIGKDYIYRQVQSANQQSKTVQNVVEKVEQKEVVKEESNEQPKNEESTSRDSPMAELSGGDYKCQYCPYECRFKDRIERHELKHLTKSDFQCNFCSFSCRNEDLLKKHERLHSSPEKAIAIINSTESPANSPLPLVMPIQPTLITAAATSTLDAAREMMQSQPASMPLRDAMKEWIMAGKNRGQKNPQAVSITVVGEDGVKRRRCVLCPYETKHIGDMRSHRAQMHTNNGKFRCTQCSYTSKRSGVLRTHIVAHQKLNDKVTNVRVQKIVANGVDIGEKRGLRSSRIYVCKSCPYVTCALVNLWRHARKHVYLPKGHICSMCTYSSTQIEKMEEHQLLHPEGHSSIKPVKHPLMSSLDSTIGSMPVRDVIQQRVFGTGTDAFSNTSFSPLNSNLVNDIPSVRSYLQRYRAPLFADNATLFSQIASISSSSAEEASKKTSPESSVSPIAAVRPPSERTTKGKRKPEYRSVVNGKTEEKKSEPKKTAPLTVAVAPETNKFLDTKDPLFNFAVHQFLKSEKEAEENQQCPDCPYVDTDVTLFRLHRELHSGRPRMFTCDLCTYSCSTAESLHLHLSLHIPQLSPNSAAIQRRKQFMRKKYHQSEIIPLGAKHYACSQCNFKTMTEIEFERHRMEHAMSKQQRLMTLIKRSASASNAATEEENRKKQKRSAKKSDKDHMCSSCWFRCTTHEAFFRHRDMHGQNAIYQCRICDYSANTKSVVDFHEQNHHVELPVSQIPQSAFLCSADEHPPKPESIKQRVKMIGQEIRCESCNFSTTHPPTMARHFEEKHVDSDEAKKEALYLRMGLFPSSNIFTTA